MNPKKSKPTDAQHTIAFVLQGGGALGAYQAGACEALAIHVFDYHPRSTQRAAR